MRSRWTRPLHSLRVRITLSAVAVTAVAVTAAGWLLVRSVEDEQVADIRDVASVYLARVARGLENGLDPVAAMDDAGPTAGPVVLQVFDDRGELVVSNLAPLGQEDGAGTDAGLPGATAPDELVAPAETVTRVVSAPAGEFTITASAPIDQVDRNVRALTVRLAVGLPLLVALVGVLAWLLVGRSLRPVDAMRAEAERITGSTMHRRLPEPPTSDEVGRLARTMNTMLDRLEAASVEQRRFVSDASHELRSPVATIRAGLEAARHKPGPDGWIARVDSLLIEEARLEALLDDMLVLAAQDESAAPAGGASRPVDLAALTMEEAQRPRPVRIDLVDPPDGAWTVVAGVRSQLTRVVGNLLDNAARHATGVVRVRVTSDQSTARLDVDDDGPGIPIGDRERVFERFTRLDDGRARDDGGSGLGLAVVRSIVTSHDGRVHIGDSPLGGARVVVELPLLASLPGQDLNPRPDRDRVRPSGRIGVHLPPFG